MNMDTREIIFVCNTHRTEVEGDVAVKVEMESWNQFYEYIKTGNGKYGEIEDFKSLKVFSFPRLLPRLFITPYFIVSYFYLNYYILFYFILFYFHLVFDCPPRRLRRCHKFHRREVHR